MHVANLDDREPFTTLDGSTIRELAGPAWTPARAQSLAEATLWPGGSTTAHHHVRTEELYLSRRAAVACAWPTTSATSCAGDCIVIPPGVGTS